MAKPRGGDQLDEVFPPPLKRCASFQLEDFMSPRKVRQLERAKSERDLGKRIQCELLAAEPKPIPLWEPLILDYTEFKGYDEVQKEAKNDPKVGREELAWVTESVDLGFELSLVLMYDFEISCRMWDNRAEGLEEAYKFDKGLVNVLCTELRDVMKDKDEHMELHGKKGPDWDETWYLVLYGRDEEGNVRKPPSNGGIWKPKRKK